MLHISCTQVVRDPIHDFLKRKKTADSSLFSFTNISKQLAPVDGELVSRLISQHNLMMNGYGLILPMNNQSAPQHGFCFLHFPRWSYQKHLPNHNFTTHCWQMNTLILEKEVINEAPNGSNARPIICIYIFYWSTSWTQNSNLPVKPIC